MSNSTIKCARCGLVIFYDNTTPNEFTGDTGYWRDVNIHDTNCEKALPNNYGQYLHSQTK